MPAPAVWGCVWVRASRGGFADEVFQATLKLPLRLGAPLR